MLDSIPPTVPEELLFNAIDSVKIPPAVCCMLRCVCCIARCMLYCMLYVALHVVCCSARCMLHVTLLFMAPCALQRLSSGIGRGADEPVGVCGAHERLLLQVDDGRSEEFDAVAPCCCMCKPLLYRIASCVLVATVLLQVTRRVPLHPVHGTSRTLQRLLHTVLYPDASEPNPTCSECTRNGAHPLASSHSALTLVS